MPLVPLAWHCWGSDPSLEAHGPGGQEMRQPLRLSMWHLSVPSHRPAEAPWVGDTVLGSGPPLAVEHQREAALAQEDTLRAPDLTDTHRNQGQHLNGKTPPVRPTGP